MECIFQCLPLNPDECQYLYNVYMLCERAAHAAKYSTVLRDLEAHTSMLFVLTEQCTPDHKFVMLPLGRGYKGGQGGMTIRRKPDDIRHVVLRPLAAEETTLRKEKFASMINPFDKLTKRNGHWTFRAIFNDGTAIYADQFIAKEDYLNPLVMNKIQH